LAVICRITCLLLLASAPAAAADRDPALAEIEAREKEARAACDAGRLDEGVRILAELFAQTDDGNYIFNQGRCYQQNGRARDAVLRFEVYLRRPDADPAASAKAEQIIAQLQPRAAPTLVEPAAPPPASDPGRTMRRAGLVVAGAGLAALGAATYFGLQLAPIKKKADDEARKMPLDRGELDRLNDDGDRAELLQWIFIGVGATAVTTGAVLTYLGLRNDDSPHGTLLRPLVAPGFAGASLTLSFR
jgi:hypothetical protein